MSESESEGVEPAPARPDGLTRRNFLGAFGGFGVGLLPGGAALTVVACGGASDTMMESSPAAAPGADVTVLENPTTVAMAIEERQVQWVVGKSPAEANAWVYTANGVTPASGRSRQRPRPVCQRSPRRALHGDLDQHDRQVDPRADAAGIAADQRAPRPRPVRPGPQPGAGRLRRPPARRTRAGGRGRLAADAGQLRRQSVRLSAQPAGFLSERAARHDALVPRPRDGSRRPPSLRRPGRAVLHPRRCRRRDPRPDRRPHAGAAVARSPTGC